MSIEKYEIRVVCFGDGLGKCKGGSNGCKGDFDDRENGCCGDDSCGDGSCGDGSCGVGSCGDGSCGVGGCGGGVKSD